jgi:hypothetical protein
MPFAATDVAKMNPAVTADNLGDCTPGLFQATATADFSLIQLATPAGHSISRVAAGRDPTPTDAGSGGR